MKMFEAELTLSYRKGEDVHRIVTIKTEAKTVGELGRKIQHHIDKFQEKMILEDMIEEAAVKKHSQ